MPAIEAELAKPLGPNRRFFAEAAEFLRQNGVPSDHVDTLRREATASAGTFERLVVDGTIDQGERIKFEGGRLSRFPLQGIPPP